jgi:phosphate transport system substrate-binding protein
MKTHPLHGPNKLKLGVFSTNADGGLAITDVPERWTASWQDNLTAAQIDFGAGAVELTTETAAKAIDTVTFSGDGNDLALDTDALFASKEADSYPLVLSTYEIVCSKGYDAETAAGVKSFLLSAANEGQEGLEAAGYVPLPDSFKERLVTAINAIS